MRLGRNLIGEIWPIRCRRVESRRGTAAQTDAYRAQAFSAVHKDGRFFASLCAYMSSGPMFVPVLQGETRS